MTTLNSVHASFTYFTDSLFLYIVVSASYHHTLFLHVLACASNGHDSCWMWFLCWRFVTLLVFGVWSRFISLNDKYLYIMGGGGLLVTYRSRLRVQSRLPDVARSVHNPVSQIDLTILNPWLRLGLSGGSTLQAPSNVTVSTISSA